ncbi:MAG: YdcF family protein [Bdellovibrio sp. CG10_big_fil_rev_8_21_14_0_10_47_8]|nr:MAG: YdcF family protein [Bdellovibrio sp. CG10_big_fil_rev_8_21_14_0_10_47_8]
MSFLRKPLFLYLSAASVAAVLFLIVFVKEYKNIRRQPVTSWTTDVSADCAVVLTGGANRVREGIDLLARKQVNKLIISGVFTNAQLREIFPLWPFYGDLAESDIVLERRSSTTYGNAQQSLPIVEALNCRDMILVTSTLHMPRAYLMFKAIYPSHLLVYQHAVSPGRGETGFTEASTEVLKSMFYSLWAY